MYVASDASPMLFAARRSLGDKDHLYLKIYHLIKVEQARVHFLLTHHPNIHTWLLRIRCDNLSHDGILYYKIVFFGARTNAGTYVCDHELQRGGSK